MNRFKTILFSIALCVGVNVNPVFGQAQPVTETIYLDTGSAGEPFLIKFDRGSTEGLKAKLFTDGLSWSASTNFGAFLWYSLTATSDAGVKIPYDSKDAGWFKFDLTEAETMGLSGIATGELDFATIAITNSAGDVISAWSQGKLLIRPNAGVTGSGTAPTTTVLNLSTFEFTGTGTGATWSASTYSGDGSGLTGITVTLSGADGGGITNLMDGIAAGTYSNIIAQIGPGLTITNMTTGAAPASDGYAGNWWTNKSTSAITAPTNSFVANYVFASTDGTNLRWLKTDLDLVLGLGNSATDVSDYILIGDGGNPGVGKIRGSADESYGITGEADIDYGVIGRASSYGVYGTAENYGVYGIASIDYGVFGQAARAYGGYFSAANTGLYVMVTNGNDAAYFGGNVAISGIVSRATYQGDGSGLTNLWNGITAGTYSNVIVQVGPDITVTNIATGAAPAVGGGIASTYAEFFSGTTNGGVDTSFSGAWYNMPIDTTAVSHVDSGGFWDSATGYWSGFTSDWVHINFTLMALNWSANQYLQVVVRKNKSTDAGGIFRRFYLGNTIVGEARSFPSIDCFINNVNGATNVYECQFMFTGGITDPTWNLSYNRVTIYGFDLP